MEKVGAHLCGEFIPSRWTSNWTCIRLFERLPPNCTSSCDVPHQGNHLQQELMKMWHPLLDRSMRLLMDQTLVLIPQCRNHQMKNKILNAPCMWDPHFLQSLHPHPHAQDIRGINKAVYGFDKEENIHFNSVIQWVIRLEGLSRSSYSIKAWKVWGLIVIDWASRWDMATWHDSVIVLGDIGQQGCFSSCHNTVHWNGTHFLCVQPLIPLLTPLSGGGKILEESRLFRCGLMYSQQASSCDDGLAAMSWGASL